MVDGFVEREVAENGHLVEGVFSNLFADWEGCSLERNMFQIILCWLCWQYHEWNSLHDLMFGHQLGRNFSNQLSPFTV